MKGALHFHLALMFICSVLPSARANSASVSWDADFGFAPSTVAIHAGDTVTWYDDDAFDFFTQVTSDVPIGNPNYFSVSLDGTGDSESLTFTNAGTFGYHDDYGSSGTLIVNPPITLTNARSAGGQFLFDAAGLIVGGTNVLQVSTNLTAWSSVQTNATGNSSATFTNAFTSNRRFFRLVELH